MNSYNHYAYASVADWVFCAAAGITPSSPGYTRARIVPNPDPRLNTLSAVLDSVHGKIRSSWKHTDDGIRFEIETPVETEVVIDGNCRIVQPGRYVFWQA